MNSTGNSQWNIGQLYRAAKRELAALSGTSPNEALLLCGHFLGVSDRAELLMRSEEPVERETAEALLNALSLREQRPLQYILGEWSFDGMMLRVGEGVLVPREDTMALVESACERLSGKDRSSPLRILDLCAGTGAVGLAAARRLPRAQVTCVELSGEAWGYLTANIERYGDGRVTALRGDVLGGPEALGVQAEEWDAILSNPPYIPAGDIAGLEREVRQEPAMALDGGTDGLDFYRAIASLWSGVVKPGGLLCMELGEGQFDDVKRMIVRHGWADIRSKTDFSGKTRAINGTKPQKI